MTTLKSIFCIQYLGLAICWLVLGGGVMDAAAPWREGRILVKYEAGGRESAEALHVSMGCDVICELRNRLELVAIPAGESVEAMVARYAAEPGVAWAEPDWLVHAAATPSDTSYLNGDLWGLHNTGQDGGLHDVDMNAPEGWDIRTSAASVIVAVIDTGIRYTHADLAGNMWQNPGETPNDGIDNDNNGIIDDVYGINADANTGDPMDDNGHGTHVAGTIGAIGNNDFGVTGVAWNVQLMACKFLASDGSGDVSNAIQCIDYAVANGAKVLNNSWGGGGFSQGLNESISAARAAGVLFVAAAGNESTNMDVSPGYPASYPQDNVVSVASLTRRGELSGFSNYGATRVDLGAPGSAIRSTWFTGDTSYNTISGTSMACPQVAGAAALLYASEPSITPGNARARLLAATQPLSALNGRCVSGGLLRLDRLLGNGLLADFEASETVGSSPLVVDFSDRSVGTVTQYLWDFGDGSSSTAASPSHTFTEDGRYTVELTVSASDGAQDSRSLDVIVSPNYSQEVADYQWRTPSAETDLALADDGTVVVTTPFLVSLYGEQAGTVVVGANGLLGLSEAGIGEYANGDLPQPNSPNGTLAVFWDDLNPSAKGRVVTHVSGATPSREFVVTWEGVPHFDDSDSAFTFQAVLFENSSVIEFHYQQVASGRSTVSGGASATVGIEDGAGARAVRVLFNGSPGLLTDQRAIRFTLPQDRRLAVSPAGDATTAGTAGGPFNPSSILYQLTNTGDATVNWSAADDQNWILLSPESGAIAPGGTVSVVATINAGANQLSAGLHVARISFDAGGAIVGDATREIRLSVGAVGGEGTLAMTPDIPFSAAGNEGGPFLPRSAVYTVANTGGESITWQAERQASWLAVSPSTGSLAAGESVDIAVSIAADAAVLSADSYSDTIVFRNLTNGSGTTSLASALEVSAGVFPESPHNYPNDQCGVGQSCDVQTYVHPGSPDALAVTFDSRTEVEIYDPVFEWGDLIGIQYPDPEVTGGVSVLAYTGTELAGQTIIIPSDRFDIRIVSDVSIRKWGYRVTQVRPIITSVLESPHPYPNSFDFTWIAEVGAHNSATYVTFSADTLLEDRYDYLRILDGSEAVADSSLRELGYTGSELAGMTIVVPGHVVQAELKTDSTVVEYGFRAAAIVGEADAIGTTVAESAHPYAHGVSETYRIERPGARSVTLTFDERTSVESDYDFISIRNESGEHVSGSPFTGAALAGASVQVNGAVADVGLATDGSVSFYGFRIVDVVAVIPVALAIGQIGAGEGWVRLDGSLRQLPISTMVIPGVEVALAAVAGEGSSFEGWTGDIVSSTEEQSITVQEGIPIDLVVDFGRQSFHLVVKPGWNFVGIPLADSRTLEALFTEAGVGFGHRYFGGANRRWRAIELAQPFDPGAAYWVRADSSGVSLALEGDPPASASIVLSPKTWHSVSPSARIVVPAAFSGRIWRWDGRRFLSVGEGQSLQPGHGYRIYSPEASELNP